MDADHIEPGQVWEVEQIAREEREARERLEAARERHMTDDGVIPHEHHELIHRLEDDWKHAVERLEHARRARGS
jgi:hypothetical protein